MYNASLGRWHVVDNKAEKYYSTTLYAYALDNPILFLDPDGNDVKVSTTTNQETGRKVVTFTVTMSVQNNTYLSNDVVNSRAQGIKSQIEQSFSGYNSETNTEYKTIVNFDQNETDYVLSFTNEVEGGDGYSTAGKVDEIGNTEKNTMQVLLEKGSDGANQNESETSRTGAHEYGHTLGLQHGETKGSILNSKSEPNLMNKTKYTKSTSINNNQLNKAKNTVQNNQNKQAELERKQQEGIDAINSYVVW